MSGAQKRIISMDIRTGYFKAIKLTKGKGGLPSHVLLDYLVKTDRLKAMKASFPIWAREMLVHPEKGGQFKKGKDVVDSQKDKKGRKWILPASDVPLEAIGREKVGLFVDPEDVTEEKGKVVVHPRSVVVLNGFIQELGLGGKVHEETRIPLEVEPELLEKLSDEEKKWLFRIDGVGVRPLVCDGDWQKVYARHGHDRNFEVVYVDLEEDVAEIEATDSRAPEAKTELQANMSADKLRELIKNADASLAELSRLAPPQKLEAIQELLQALEIKE